MREDLEASSRGHCRSVCRGIVGWKAKNSEKREKGGIKRERQERERGERKERARVRARGGVG